MKDGEAFLSHLRDNPPATKEAWLACVREAAYHYSQSTLRTDIAMSLVGEALLGFKVTAEEAAQIQPIKDMLYDLEVPDAHVAPGFAHDYTDEEMKIFDEFAQMYVSYKWRKLAELLATNC